MTYADACRQATTNQGLADFLAREGWTVEQTGGFTMVACRYTDDGHVWTVTNEGEYMVCHQTIEGWNEGTEPADDAYRFGLSLAEVFALTEATKDKENR